MFISDLEYISSLKQIPSCSQAVTGGIVASARGGAFGNTFGTVSVFTGAFSISAKFNFRKG